MNGLLRPFADLSTRGKMLTMLLAVGLGSCALIGFVGYETAQSALRGRILEQLASTSAAKSYELESYFKRLENQVRTFGEDPTVIQAAKELNQAFHKLNSADVPVGWNAAVDDYYTSQLLPALRKNLDVAGTARQFFPISHAAQYLQYWYIVKGQLPESGRAKIDDANDGSDYSRIHAIFNPIFRSYIEKFGYGDMLIVDDETGDVIYTVRKRPDFTSNVVAGAFKSTNFSRAVAASREDDKPELVKLVDFEPYLPADGAPVAFISGPIYDRLKHVGNLVFEMPVDDINRIMTDGRRWKDHGLGSSGENYLVGSDYRIRSEPRMMVEHMDAYLDIMQDHGLSSTKREFIRRMHTSILQNYVRTRAVDDALRGKTGTMVGDNFLGVRSVASYSPLHVADLNWVLISEINEDEALAPIRNLHIRLILWTLALSLVVIVIAMLMTEAFVRPIHSLMDGAERFGRGEHNVEIHTNRRDEFGQLARTFNAMVSSISEKTRIIEQKNEENERLLLNILPSPVASRLKQGELTIADGFAEATVLFGDLVGFTKFSATVSAEQLVSYLNDLIRRFDEAALKHGIEKIKTIGDCYMAASNIPSPQDQHCRAMVRMAVDMMRILEQFNHERGTSLQMRIGVNCGPVVAGVIGSTKFIYDLWGDTVNLASRMESTGIPGAIQVSESVVQRLQGEFPFEDRGLIEVKGKGQIHTWILRQQATHEVAIA